ncbi:MAG: flagellar assembly protein FliW [Ignavibacteriales bacterium]|nr:MAG: flagellar assembly protein FliW [Stygiobacter sp.]KAF0216503.1 MAG: flagellar assembly protein [Ignavibacteria bacterium]MBI3123079.1 flagellar assembly protein FliW [Ignavibacteriales bacterium]OGU64603.1 MAG: flagellar biosynthesis protein FliW [Stygiobacter sp. GWC2_38_9]OGU83715.1 MAG: flagellar biosynthesis protein FliW [Stygiobacter sp. RIFOXYA12_FULL_38_9]OGV07938.1 MAG: flagellar biosynthesis protein FliW [Stygiobacter sp. RIFOXYB2_FULL_37_11]OGV12066.1 MAG: flagellar biosynth
MKIKTYHFGEVEFAEDKVLTFEGGLFGFEELKEFVFIKPDDSIFYWINSVENPELAFPMFGVRIIDETYPQEESYEAFGIVVMNPDPLKITVNLKAPVYINQDERKGFQKIIDADKYPVYYNLFTE